MKIKLPIDVFSKKRLIFNLAVYLSYTMIFLVSYIAAYLVTGLFVSGIDLDMIVLFDIFLLIVAVKFFVFNFFNFKRFALYSTETYDIYKTSVMIIISGIVLLSLRTHIGTLNRIPGLTLIFDSFFSFGTIILFNTTFRYFYHRHDHVVNTFFSRNNYANGYRRTLIIGAGSIGQYLYKTLGMQKVPKYQTVGFVDDDPELIGKQLHGIKIYGPIDNIVNIALKLKVKQLIVAMPSAPAKRIKAIIDAVKETDIFIATIPSYMEIIEGKVKVDSIREIKIEDLLKRDKVEIDDEMIYREISNRNVLVTGAAGSIGSEICRQLCKYSPKTIIAVDQAETPLFYLERELLALKKKTNIVPFVADITNGHRLISIFREYRPYMVLHAAAYKHVPMMEENFEEALTNNVLGTKNVADIANLFETNLFVMISTDKAVNPSSIMGLTKRISEIYIQGVDQISRTKYATVRFGNVLDSAGNVTQIFKKQIKEGGPVTVTHPEMTRYFMVTSEAVQLVLQAGLLGKGGEIFMLDMGEPVKIVDLAKSMIKISGYKVGKDIEIVYSGLRPGEKLFEELRYNDESMLPTPNPKIFVWNSRKGDFNTIDKKIKEIIKNIYNTERQEITDEIINSLVPEYRNENKKFKYEYEALANNS
jgi:FlaA1/EpsC-like NDP-sugar epimerase